LARFLAAAAEDGGQQYPNPMADERGDRQDDRYYGQYDQEIVHDPNLRMSGAAFPQV
jgi:hypothetical protein